MTSIGWHPIARRELFEASAFYEAEAVGLGEVFPDAIQQGIDVLVGQPRVGRRVLRETRRFVIARFPYGTVYRAASGADEDSGRLFILAVAHHKRRPRFWARRDP